MKDNRANAAEDDGLPIHRGKERASIARLIIDLAKTVHGGKFLGPGKHYRGGKVELLFISGAVLIGDVEGRPKTSSEIARFLGFPRVTTQRKLDALAKQGVVERRGTRYFVSRNTAGDVDADIDKAQSLIKRGAL